MPSKETIQKLIEARNAGLKHASESRDVDELMSWHSRDATFVHEARNIHLVGITAVRGFYAQAYASMPKFRILSSNTSGCAEFVATEMVCEGEFGPGGESMGVKEGDIMKIKGVSLFWWKWEGEGEEWDGDLGEESVRGWKIVEEHGYHDMEMAKKGETE